MAWLIIIVSVFVMWISTLCKILHTARASSKASFLSNGGSFHQRNVLLVIAHPDDESMFFTPTINYLTSRGHSVHIICMSTGNANGMGNIRKEELYQASAVLKIPVQQVKILDHPEFQDGFGKVWNCELLASIIDEEIRSHAIDLIITFDNYGVSGHCNHREVNLGIRGSFTHKDTLRIKAHELQGRKMEHVLCLLLVAVMTVAGSLFWLFSSATYVGLRCFLFKSTSRITERKHFLWGLAYVGGTFLVLVYSLPRFLIPLPHLVLMMLI